MLPVIGFPIPPEKEESNSPARRAAASPLPQRPAFQRGPGIRPGSSASLLGSQPRGGETADKGFPQRGHGKAPPLLHVVAAIPSGGGVWVAASFNKG